MLNHTKIRAYISLMRLDKPIGMVLLAWPALWAIAIATPPDYSPKLILIFLMGIILMRSAGCVMNDYVDRHLDGKVERTRQRPFPSGRVSGYEAWLLFVLLCLLASVLLLALPTMTCWLALPAVVMCIFYPHLKRITHLPQIGLGIAFSWSIPMVFTAQMGYLPLEAGWLFMIAMIWAVAYDTMYAMIDRPDDVYIGIKSTAILWGDKETTVIAILHLTLLFLLTGLGWYLAKSYYYYMALTCVFLLMSYQQYLIEKRLPNHCFKAFCHSQWVGGLIFLGLLSP